MLGVFAVARGGFVRCRAEYLCTGGAVYVSGITNTVVKHEIGSCKAVRTSFFRVNKQLKPPLLL